MIETLKNHINKIVQISNSEYLEIESYFETKKFKKNDYLTEAGQLSHDEFYVIKGLVFSFYINDAGQSCIMQFAGDGQWICDIKNFSTTSVNNVSIKCIEDSEVLCITFFEKERLCALSKKMEYFFRIKENMNNGLLFHLILIFRCSNAKYRYKEFVKQYPKIHKRIPVSAIGSYLGISRATLMKLKI